MLDKQGILYIMKKLNFKKDGYWIESGSSLVLHGVRDLTNDVDIGCTHQFMDYLVQLGYECKYTSNKLRVIRVGGIVEIFEEIDFNKPKIEIINNLPVASLGSVRKQKELLGRDKDKVDIALIDKFLDSRCKK